MPIITGPFKKEAKLVTVTALFGYRGNKDRNCRNSLSKEATSKKLSSILPHSCQETKQTLHSYENRTQTRLKSQTKTQDSLRDETYCERQGEESTEPHRQRCRTKSRLESVWEREGRRFRFGLGTFFLEMYFYGLTLEINSLCASDGETGSLIKFNNWD